MEKETVFSNYIPVSLAKKFKEKCRRKGMKIKAVLRRLIENYVEGGE